jgi:hypothetical protein
MARDRANISTTLWADQDWRELPKDAKYLYMLLLSHPTLNYAGVGDWRAARIAAMSPDDTVDDTRANAAILQNARFIFVDEETEEVLVRSFLRHDGLLKQPKLSISMVNAFSSIASKSIREIVTRELQRLHAEHPDWSAFGQEKVMTLVKGKGTDMSEFTQGFTHSFTPGITQGFTQEVRQPDAHGQALPTSTTTTTSTSNEVDRGSSPNVTRTKTPTTIPDDFAMTSSMQAWAMRTIGTRHHIDLAIETEKFIAHAGEKNTTSSSWPDSWRKWILKAVEFAERDRATAPLGAYGTIEDIKKLYNNRPAREPVEAIQ